MQPSEPHVTRVYGSGPPPAARQGAAVSYRDVVKHFGAVQALRGVSFEVVPGEIHGVVGENGAGKSTLVGLTAGKSAPTSGEIVIFDEPLDKADPRISQRLGVAAVHQDPALFPDLTVAENLWLKVAAKPVRRAELNRWAAGVLEAGIAPGLVQPDVPAEHLTMEERYTVELAAALYSRPRLLILDEPTEHLSATLVSVLFDRLNQLRAEDIAIIYISHRLPDVLGLADRVTILRDGLRVDTVSAEGYPVGQLISMIAGRPIGSIFPEKTAVDSAAPEMIAAHSLSGSAFWDIELAVRAGEVVGLAGVEGNGQRDFLRALAGLVSASGRIEVQGQGQGRWDRPKAMRMQVEYLPRDRRGEGLFGSLSVLENLRVYERPAATTAGFVNPRRVADMGAQLIERYRIRTGSAGSPVSSLSGGNAQKTILARTLAREPKVLLLDEPSQGVDVGAREDIYHYIRDSTASGSAVIIAGSDAAELAGLCDRVLVFSRGRVIRELAGGDVTELNIVGAAVTHESRAETTTRSRRSGSRLPKLWAVLAVLNIAVAILGVSIQSRYLSELNIGFLLSNLTTLAFVAMAQQALLFFGGIDLSVGPLAGLVVIIGSFAMDGANVGIGSILEVAGLCLAVMTVVALLNWFLGDVVGLTAFVGTLATYVLLQAVMTTLRPTPGGLIATGAQQALTEKIGPVPVVAIACAVIAVVLELTFYRTRLGAHARAVGSSQDVAAVVGLRSSRARLGAYLLASLLALFAGAQFLPQVGIGISTAGVSYSISSITAAIVGGATMTGGRGSFVGAFFGAMLVEQSLSLTSFLKLGSASQYYFVGGLIVLAALVGLRRNAGSGAYPRLLARLTTKGARA
jgi:ribose transport system ATP-binding protein